MDSSQSNKLAMFLASSDVLGKSTVMLREIPALPENVAQFDQTVNEIKTMAAEQAKAISGTAADRDTALDAAADEALITAGKLLSFATKNNLAELAQTVRLSYSDFRAGRKLECIQLAQAVRDAAQPILSQLAPYGVTAESLAHLDATIAAANAAVTAPRSVMTTRKSATSRLKVLFREADKLLGSQIDPLLLPLAKSDPKWYAKYRASREIIDLPGAPGPGNGNSTPAVPATPATPATPAKPAK